MLDTVYAILDYDYGVDGRMSPPLQIIKRVFDFESEAKEAVFPPFEVVEIEVDAHTTLLELHAKLTPLQKYAIGCYNEIGIRDYLINGKD